MSGSAAKRPVPKRPDALIDAAAATKVLGVSRNTLYAYVSRGLVRSTEHPSRAKASLYVAADVQALVARKAMRLLAVVRLFLLVPVHGIAEAFGR